MRGNGRIWVAEQVSNTASLSPKVVPLQAPSKGEDVPGGIWNAGCWGGGRRKKSG